MQKTSLLIVLLFGFPVLNISAQTYKVEEKRTYKPNTREFEITKKDDSYQNPKLIQPADPNAFSNGFIQGFNQTQAIMASMNSMYANISKSGNANYFPNRNKKAFNKLNVYLKERFGSINIDLDYTGNQDNMYVGQKLALALKDYNFPISSGSPYDLKFSYSYRPDTGCGGVVIDKLQLFIVDKRDNSNVGQGSFSQSVMEGKCIDDVLFQFTERLMRMNDAKTKTDYTESILTEETNSVNTSQNKPSMNVYDELLKLKDLFDNGILTKEEYDSKATELKKLIINQH